MYTTRKNDTIDIRERNGTSTGFHTLCAMHGADLLHDIFSRDKNMPRTAVNCLPAVAPHHGSQCLSSSQSICIPLAVPSAAENASQPGVPLGPIATFDQNCSLLGSRDTDAIEGVIFVSESAPTAETDDVGAYRELHH